MPLDRSHVESALLRKGFIRRDGDHRFYLFVHDGKVTPIFTKVSHSPKHKTLDDSLLSYMARQTKLTNKQFRQLVDCTLSHDDYLDHLRSIGISL
jgi:hypothetical protein